MNVMQQGRCMTGQGRSSLPATQLPRAVPQVTILGSSLAVDAAQLPTYFALSL